MLSSMQLWNSVLNSSTTCRQRISCTSLLRIVKRRYSKVLVRDVPDSMAKALSMSSTTTTTFDLSKAKRQHESYLQVMKSIFPSTKIIQLKADDTYPDCVFIEDTAVVIDNRAVICRIGAESRRGEVDETKKALLDLGLEVFDMRQDTNLATCDGGDVLYPVSYHNKNNIHSKKGGKHLFVGISNRTNMEGANYLQTKFPDVNVIPIQLKGDSNNEVLHLKSAVTHIDEKTLLIPTGSEWNYMVDSFMKQGEDFEIIRLPDIAACNVVSVNGHILAPDSICELSKEILHDTIVQTKGLSLHFVEANEFAKYDGALTCKSILLQIGRAHV